MVGKVSESGDSASPAAGQRQRASSHSSTAAHPTSFSTAHVIIPPQERMKLAHAVAHATSATQRADLIRNYAGDFGVSEATARRHAGVRVRPMKPRSVASDPVLDQVVALWLASQTEKYDRATMPIADVIDMCEVAGVIGKGAVSRARLRRYIREQQITLTDQRRGAPHIHQRSEYPNHVHLADVTRCRQWYLKHDGRFDAQSFTRGTAEYRNKDLRGVPLYRYVLVDHTTGMLYVQYCTDETVPTLLTFLAGAWLPKRQRRGEARDGRERWWPAPFDPHGYEAWEQLPMLRDYPFRGAPRVLVLDRAGANQSEFTAQLCQRLGIELVIAQEARAKGAVEAMMWIWERKFEARLAIQPAHDLETLNVWALDFTAHWCLEKVHSRHGMTRTQAWAQIENEQLRELPAWPIFRELARREPEPRTVKSADVGGVVHHEGRVWRVADHTLIGQIVHVSYSVFQRDALEARTPDGRVLLLEEAKKDRWGFLDQAATIGQEYRRHPDTATQQTEKRLEAVRAALPQLEVFGREGEKQDLPALLAPKRGVEISVQTTRGTRELDRRSFNRIAVAELGELTDVEALERNRRLQGRTAVPELDVQDFIEWCRARRAANAAAPTPKVVNLFTR